jgi:rhodanese-related sulfurtransferase
LFCKSKTRAAGALLLLSLLFTIGSSVRCVHAQISQEELELTAYFIMPETLLYKIMKGEDDYILVDVRTEEEFRLGHVSGALSYPWEDGTFVERRGEFPRNKMIILISRDGNAALKALQILLQDEYQEHHESFREVFSIEGGMENWPYNEYLATE